MILLLIAAILAGVCGVLAVMKRDSYGFFLGASLTFGFVGVYQHWHGSGS